MKSLITLKNLRQDLPAGLVTFLVALPLCLGIALASGAPLFSGVMAGIIGGIVVGSLSGSPTSVSGPAAGLAAIVLTQIENMGFESFLFAVMIAGLLQIVLGLIKAGSFSSFFPSSVVKGLLTAIGVLLILKQLPHLVGHDPDPVGEMSFQQPDHESTLSELGLIFQDFQLAAIVTGFLSLLILVGWSRVRFLEKSGIPVPLVAVIVGTAIQPVLASLGARWALGADHLVQVPVLSNLGEAKSLLVFPDFSLWNDQRLYVAAVTLALVASLETLLNLDAVDNIDPKQRTSPPNRELIAQGIGNTLGGLVGALPVTSVVVRSSVNVQAGNETKISAIFHGVLLALCVLFIPQILNLIPLSTLAAILIVTGFKLASPKLVKSMWDGGKPQFVPYATTVFAIVFTDLLLGVLIGLAVSIGFILRSNLARPLKKVMEKHVTGDVLRIELSEQVSFFNRAAIEHTLDSLGRGSRVIIDASNSDFIDPDVLLLIKEFKQSTAETRSVTVSLVGFKEQYSQIEDEVLYEDFATREVQERLTPKAVLDLLRAGNSRFLRGQRLQRDWSRQVAETAKGQAPLAVILSCIDSRNSSELIFDLGIGDIMSVRIAGNVAKTKVLGSIEFSCAVAGAKLIVVMGHTRCGAVSAAVRAYGDLDSVERTTGCAHIRVLLESIQDSMDPNAPIPRDPEALEQYADGVAVRHVHDTIEKLMNESAALSKLVKEGTVGIVGGLYDVKTGQVHFFGARGPLADELSEPSDFLLPESMRSLPGGAGQVLAVPDRSLAPTFSDS